MALLDASGRRVGGPRVAPNGRHMNPTSVPRNLSARVLAALAVLAALTLAFAPAASAEPVPVSYVKLGAGFNDVFEDQDAGSYVFTVDGKEVLAYCADVTKAFNGDANFSVVPSDAASLTGIGEAGWIVANAESVPTPAADADTEAAAIQVAVWAYTNGITIDDTTVPYEPVRTRAQALVAAAAGKSVDASPTSFSLTMAGTVDGDVARFTAKLTTDAGDPIAGEYIEFSATDAEGTTVMQDVETGADGVATWEVPAAEFGGAPVDGKARWAGQVAAGSVIVPDDGSQPLVLAEPVEVVRHASTTADTTPAPPAADGDPATGDPEVTAAPVEQLPYTGGSLGVPHLVVALVALAAAGFVVVRMRRAATA